MSISSVSSVGVSMLCSQSAVDSPAVSSKDIVSSESSILSTTASVRAVESSEGVSRSYGARSAYGGGYRKQTHDFRFAAVGGDGGFSRANSVSLGEERRRRDSREGESWKATTSTENLTEEGEVVTLARREGNLAVE